ncbi:MAG: 5'-methylthioadenosine/S-adenosylhomocysteine nucleosidase [Bdellovibrionales bacterium]|nr:5'-methylthioadenosine/S-adenosylhomocysteine nucleosidase [Bdellovibrionales bacterium]
MIALTTAHKGELSPLLALLKQVHSESRSHRKYHFSQTNDIPLVLTHTGQGKICNAVQTQKLIHFFSPSLLIHFGVAGALSPELKVGDLTIADQVWEHDYHSLRTLPPKMTLSKEWIKLFEQSLKGQKKAYKIGSFASGNEDIISQPRRDELFHRFSSIAVDWESAASVQTANFNSVPILIAKGISDLATEALENSSASMKYAAQEMAYSIHSFLSELKLEQLSGLNPSL